MSVGWLSYQHFEVRTQWARSMKQENVAMVTKLLIIHVKSRQLTQKLCKRKNLMGLLFTGYILTLLTLIGV